MKSSEVRAAWGGTPPATIDRVPFTFWDGTTIPGGVHPLIVTSLQWLDTVFQRHQYRLDRYAPGDDWCYNRRHTKYGKVWSLHSWAIAVDINATENPYSRRFQTTIPPAAIRDIQAVRHPNSNRPLFQWGGTWGLNGSRFDTMHFQTSLTPADAQSMPGPAGYRDPDPTGTVVLPPGVAGGGTGMIELAEQVAKLQEQVVYLERRSEVLSAVIGGVPYWQVAQWVLSGVLERGPTDREIAGVVDRFIAGENLTSVYASLVAQHGGT